jgi:hypothetical protein
VRASRSFGPPPPARDAIPEKLLPLLETCLPYYDELARERLRVE